jgi:hypothetical protein
MADFIKVNFSMDIAQFIKTLSSRELGDLMLHANQESAKRSEEFLRNLALTQPEIRLVGKRDKVMFAKALRDRLGADNVRLKDTEVAYESYCKRIPSSVERVDVK